MWRRLALLSPAISSSSSSSKHYLLLISKADTTCSEVTSTVHDGKCGPGSGKGTQCARIASAFGFAHLSAGDLLREEMSSESTNGELIRNIIKEGKIVPSDITVNLIRKAIKSSTTDRFLIDGFPRSEENRIAFERIVGVEPDLVLFFDCPEEEMVKRVLGRNQGRIDDNIETIKKRLEVFENLNVPVINYYSTRGKVYKISAKGNVDEIFAKVHQLFSTINDHELEYSSTEAVVHNAQ